MVMKESAKDTIPSSNALVLKKDIQKYIRNPTYFMVRQMDLWSEHRRICC